MNGVERVFPLWQQYSEAKGVAGMERERYREYSAEGVELGWRPTQSVAEVVVGKLKAHSQILRIRAEDSHLGKDIGEGNLSLRLKDRFGVTMHFMLFSRPILPASPLSGKTAY